MPQAQCSRSGKSRAPNPDGDSATGVAQLSARGRLVANNAARTFGCRRRSATQSPAGGVARASQTTVLTGQAMVRDTGSENPRRRLRSFRQTSDIELRGRCARRTSLRVYFVADELGAGESFRDRMRANSKTGAGVTGACPVVAGSVGCWKQRRSNFSAVAHIKCHRECARRISQAPQPGAAPGATPVWHISSGC